ncbi:MAG TPA: TRAFs-binding domain-containing protein [Pyrinomonadaceae bacterium]|nr:TRAFs-binding domain-containing protein [Pyrinomonadaceae bacterium]
MNDRPLCFVLMPFGQKRDPAGGPDIDFDRVYEDAIRPGIEAAGMEPVRADEERTGGIIHRAMFERLLLCDFAVADLTTANANVFYELGVRHAARPATTLPIFAGRQMPPFDVNYLRALPYELDERNRLGAREAGLLREALTRRLTQLRDLAREDAVADSPVFQLLKDEYREPDIARLKTDVFRDRVRYAAGLKRRLAGAREAGDVEALAAIEAELGPPDAAEAGVLIDLFLSYRAVEEWGRMIELYERLPATLRRAVMLREQLALALNRAKRRREAVEVLEQLIEEQQGGSSETYGILGRVYKDTWADESRAAREAAAAGDEAAASRHAAAAAGHLERAAGAYVRGFEADWRDAYPGINAVTLLDIRGDQDSLRRKAELMPVVRFAVAQRLKSAAADYWDHATMLELSVLDGDEAEARAHLGRALAAVREKWEPRTTANNLTLLRDARRARGRAEPWLDEIITQLEGRAK